MTEQTVRDVCADLRRELAAMKITEEQFSRMAAAVVASYRAQCPKHKVPAKWADTA